MKVRRRALLAAGVALLGGVLWWAAARWLWPTTVPSGLRLSGLDTAHYFSRSFLRRSASYERFLDVDGVLAEVVLVGVLCVYAARGHRFMKESAAGPIGTGMMLGMLGFAVVWIAELPFGLAAVWWERSHGVSHQGYVGWVFESFGRLGGTFVFVCFALLVAMGLARVLGRWWWAVAAPVFAGLALLAAFVGPFLLTSTHPLREPRLLAETSTLARREGVSGRKVEVQEVKRFTTAPNAESVGWGSTSRLVLWDTLLSGRFGRREVRFVVAHELGHISRKHILKGVGWTGLFLIPMALLIAWATAKRGGMGRPEAVPVALLVLTLFTLAMTPVRNAISRRMEGEADWRALVATHDPAAARMALRRLAVTSLTDPDPPWWAYTLEATHPSIAQRIAMANTWERESRRP
ncbi:MAG TPA: M48 family metalloprotease [Solirubrobacteraceae bacterium]|jgi:STE24 endopeptidase